MLVKVVKGVLLTVGLTISGLSIYGLASDSDRWMNTSAVLMSMMVPLLAVHSRLNGRPTHLPPP